MHHHQLEQLVRPPHVRGTPACGEAPPPGTYWDRLVYFHRNGDAFCVYWTGWPTVVCTPLTQLSEPWLRQTLRAEVTRRLSA